MDDLIVFVGGPEDQFCSRRRDINPRWLHPDDDRLYNPEALHLGVYKRDSLTGEFLYVGTTL